MLTELCGYLKNWFEVNKLYGDFAITDNHVTYADGTELPLQDGQYFRVIGSIFNDGVYISSFLNSGDSAESPENMRNEEFNGSIWLLAIPQDVIAIADEISAWRAKYEGEDSAMLSPYTSESFGGYSYSKGNDANGSMTSWQTAFNSRLSNYRKV